VTERHTAIDVAHQLKWLVDEAYPDARTICVVLDNLNVHATASLYTALPAPEARRLAKKLEFHFTPTHGSRLNVAECELAVLASQCLGRRLPDLPTACSEIAAWERQRNLERLVRHDMCSFVHWHGARSDRESDGRVWWRPAGCADHRPGRADH
jgi:hypothetical protein